ASWARGERLNWLARAAEGLAAVRRTALPRTRFCEPRLNEDLFGDRFMGQKVRPTGFRTGIMVDWLSRWYANKQDFAELLVEDFKIRAFIKKKYARSGIARIKIER